MSEKSEFNFPSIYLILNKITEVAYVGQAMNTRKRWANHRRALSRGLHGNSHLQRAWNKYGPDNFIFQVEIDCSQAPKEKLRILLNQKEIEILKNFKDRCYNLMEAGINGLEASLETLEKLSVSSKKRWKNPEFRKKISDSQKAAWGEPGRKEERIAQYRESFKKPEYKKRRKEISEEFWAVGGCLRETQSAKRKANWQDPEYVAKQKLSREMAWKDPIIRERRIRAIKEGHAKRKAKNLYISS